MEVRTPSPLPLQPGMDTGFDPPGQPAPPRPVTGGGARVRIAAPAERWGGFGTRVSGSRDRPAMSWPTSQPSLGRVGSRLAHTMRPLPRPNIGRAPR